ncbi:MAG TPA: colicin immunity protein, partial [Methylobacter sp.]
MKSDRTLLYDSSNDFFELDGTDVMTLTSAAAQDVCTKALKHGVVVVRIEGGIWHNPGFEARLDCIWDGVDPPVSETDAAINNARALEMICE